MKYNLEHWNTHKSRKKFMSTRFLLLPFLAPSDPEGFLHTLIRSLSAECVPGRLWCPVTFVPGPPPGGAGRVARSPPRGSTGRRWARGRFRCHFLGLSLNTEPQAHCFPLCLPSHRQGSKTKALPESRSDKPLLLWFTDASLNNKTKYYYRHLVQWLFAQKKNSIKTQCYVFYTHWSSLRPFFRGLCF